MSMCNDNDPPSHAQLDDVLVVGHGVRRFLAVIAMVPAPVLQDELAFPLSRLSFAVDRRSIRSRRLDYGRGQRFPQVSAILQERGRVHRHRMLILVAIQVRFQELEG